MTTRMESLPDGYIRCTWCAAACRLDANGNPPTTCHSCRLDPRPQLEPGKKTGKKSPGKKSPAKKGSLSHKGAPKIGELSRMPLGKPVMGIDPGSRYTGVVVRDGDVVMHSTTLVRPKEMKSSTDWALVVVAQIQGILRDFPVTLPMGIEGISDPKGFQHGKNAAINPKDIIRAGIVLGAVVAIWPNIKIIEPGGNGSQHISHYPPELVGRRPATLPGSSQGAGTRNHEQSAYDVAGKAAKEHYKIVIPDIK